MFDIQEISVDLRNRADETDIDGWATAVKSVMEAVIQANEDGRYENVDVAAIEEVCRLCKLLIRAAQSVDGCATEEAERGYEAPSSPIRFHQRVG